jgi:hypothetical protein
VQIVNLTPEVHLRWDCPVSEEEQECHGQWFAMKGSTCNWRLHQCALAVSFILCCIVLHILSSWTICSSNLYMQPFQ